MDYETKEYLSEVSYEDLLEEVKRREAIKKGPWPKTVVVELDAEVSNKNDLWDFLRYECLIDPEETDGIAILDYVSSAFKVELSVFADGSHRITKFDGRKIQDEEE